MPLKSLPQPVLSGSITLQPPGEAYVYRAYCKCGDLLYVGITNDIFTRVTAHRRTGAEWERKAVRLDWDVYRTRVLAEAVEEHLIKTLHPIYNVSGRTRVGRIPRWQDLPWPTFRDPGDTPEERFFARARRHMAAVAATRV